jgi:nucleoside-diphosphate-sugar epimerase
MYAARALVTGGGGFIGHHLTRFLVNKGYWVRAIDIKEPEYEPTAAHEFLLLDLREKAACEEATRGMEHVYGLAANMGGIGFIESNKAVIVRDNTLINLNSIEAAYQNGVKRYLYTSSACIYPGYRQQSADVTPLREEDAYPADAEDGYGWEKLYMERVCRHYREDFGLATRVVRFHNIFGPLGTYDGGREKSPAAICRKVAQARDGDAIE